MSPWWREFFARADHDLVDGGYRAMSVDAERVRRQLRTANRPYLDPGAPAPPLDDLDATARWLADQARLKSSVLGGFAGLAGVVSVPSEAAAQGIGLLRLAQRLAVVYGFDPATDRGRTALWRALAAALDIQLPEGPVALRIREIPDALTRSEPPRSVGSTLARAIALESVRYVSGRFGRFLPIVSSGFAASDARRRTDRLAERMISVFRRLSEPGALPEVFDADVIQPRP